MNRSKRLFELLALLKCDQKMPMSKITAAFPASARTVYRDIGTLVDLGYVVKTDDGYSLVTQNFRPFSAQFNDMELRLIRFALETHQLGKVFPFHELSARLANATAPDSHRLKLKTKGDPALGKEVTENRLSSHPERKSRWLKTVTQEQESKK